MVPSLTVRRTAIGVSAAYALVLYLTGIHLQDGLRQALTYLPTVAALAVVAFDKWVWKWSVIGRLHDRPRVEGLWRCQLTPDKQSHIPQGGNWGPIESYVVIEQTFWSVSVVQHTDQSSSYSKATAFTSRPGSQLQSLIVAYNNEPNREHIQRSVKHSGACEYRAGKHPTTMSGPYFTDRFTAGDMELRLIDRSTHHADFATAKAHAGRMTPARSRSE